MDLSSASLYLEGLTWSIPVALIIIVVRTVARMDHSVLPRLRSPLTNILAPLNAVMSGGGPVVQLLLPVPLHVGGRHTVVALSPLRPESYWCHDVVSIVSELLTIRGPTSVTQLPGQLL